MAQKTARAQTAALAAQQRPAESGAFAGDTARPVSDTLKKLISMSGMEDFRQTVAEWEQIARHIAETAAEGAVVLPDYFCVAKPGSGVSNLLETVTHFLEEHKLQRFSQDVKFCEFFLDYTHGDTFPAFERLYDLLEHRLSRFGRSYAGLISVDITEWVQAGAMTEPRFFRFLDYLSYKDDETLVLFVSNCCDEPAVRAAEQVLASRFRIRRITLDAAPADELVHMLESRLKEKGLTMSDEAEAVIGKTLKSIPKIPGYEGMRTIDTLAKDIVYEKFLRGSSGAAVITAADVHRFSENGEWVHQFEEAKKKFVIGFGGQID